MDIPIMDGKGVEYAFEVPDDVEAHASKVNDLFPAVKTIETAPKDGTEILAWREDCGWFIARWTCAVEFLTESEQEKLDEDSLFAHAWFGADFVAGFRAEGSEAPTHWMALPPDPVSV